MIFFTYGTIALNGSGDTLTMTGGTIKANSNDGAAVNLNASGSKFYFKGGSIKAPYNISTQVVINVVSGAIYNRTGGTLEGKVNNNN